MNLRIAHTVKKHFVFEKYPHTVVLENKIGRLQEEKCTMGASTLK